MNTTPGSSIQAEAPTSHSTVKAAARVLMIQDGARLHYAIPVALQRAKILQRVYTNWYAAPGTIGRLASKMVGWADRTLSQKMLDRYCPELDSSKVISLRSMIWDERRGLKKFSSMLAYHAWISERFAIRVRRRGWQGADTLAGFIRNIHPDLCRAAQEEGLRTIADQMIAPYSIELAEEKLQQQLFPDWSPHAPDLTDDALIAFEQATWRHLDHITCASPYVKDGLIAQGIETERISVLPYPLDTAELPFHNRSERAGPLTIGFVGAVGLRKGAPYFAQVAKRLAGPNLKFVMVGPVDLTPAAATNLKSHVEVVGPVPRSQVRDYLKRFDIYFFPSTCEGSAGSVMEAMATGLPVVTSPNSGTIIGHGESGFIAPYADVDAHAAAIEKLAGDETLRLAMGRAARKTAEACTIDAYSKGWSDMLYALPPSRVALT